VPRAFFRWSSSVQTVCDFARASWSYGCGPEKSRPGCRPPPDSSPIQINTEGKYGNEAFVVVAASFMIRSSGWNEWHVMMNDGTSAWLPMRKVNTRCPASSKAQNLPAVAPVHVGQQFDWSDQRYYRKRHHPSTLSWRRRRIAGSVWDKTDVTSSICEESENSPRSIIAIPSRLCILGDSEIRRS